MKFLKLLLITWSLSLNAGLPPLPSPAGNAGKFLTNDGTKMSWGSATVVGPPGTVLVLAASSCPSGTLLADGSAISRTTYSQLYLAIGNSHGSGDGSTTFNLPDYRGRFLRGVDGGTGRDPNAASRTAMATGGNTGNAVGSVQDDAFQGHAHGYYDNQSGTGSSGAAGTSSWRDLTTYAIRTDGVNGTPRTAAETRPINANVIYCVVTVSLTNAAVASIIDPIISIISATNIDWALIKSNTGLYTKTLSANTTFTFSNLTAGQAINVRLTNTASNYTVTWPTVKWPGGTTPTMTTGAKSDIYSFFYDGTDIYGSYVQNY